jgi:hypothetical protein
MRVLIVTVIVLLVASTCGAQAPASNLPPPDSQTQTETPAQPPASAMQMIVVPEGTRIPATLTSPISNKAARPGTPVRAVTSFPVTVGGVVAIPVGTYLEGAIDKVTRNRRTGDTMRMHDIDPARPVAFTSEDEPHLVLTAQQPQPPPLPHTGPSEGTAIGIGVGLAAAGIIAIVVLAHHGGGGNGIVFDTGWQFEMVLQAPLPVNAASVAAAAAATSGT